MARHYTTDIPTLGVNVTDKVNLYVNPYFWDSLSLKEQVDVLKHECYHVVNNHFVRFRDLEPQVFDSNKKSFQEKIEAMEKASLCNQAADFAINEMLVNLPKQLKMFDKNGQVITYPEFSTDENGNKIPHPEAGQPILGKPCLVDNLKVDLKNPNILNDQHLEYYYEILKQNNEQNGGGNSSQMVLDDHSLWGEGTQDEEFINEKIKQTVSKAVEQSGGREAGKIPSDILSLIDALFHKAKDWKNDLQKFAAKTSEIVVETSRKCRNRRYGVIYPGSKVYPKLHLAVVIDTSGSITEDELTQFVAEIDRMTKNNVKVTVIECDAEVQNTYDFEKIKCLKNLKLTGRGGTMFQPAFDKATSLDIDGLIYLTDGVNGDHSTLKKPKYPVMWAILKGYSKPYDWGFHTEIKVQKKSA
jgi:predicted metal-dependent peptidase